MLFELRGEPAAVSPRWESIRDLYLRGQAREAWDQANRLRSEGLVSDVHDFLLNIEIARACGAMKTYMALVRIGIREHADHPLMQLYHARVLLTRKRHLAAMQYLESLEETLGASHPAYWATELASVYGDAGFSDTCRRLLERAQQHSEYESPLARYTSASALESLLEWEQAIENLRSCLRMRPGWARARAFLAHCLMARGRREEAMAELIAVEEHGWEDAGAECSAAMISMMSGEYDVAADRFRRAVERWPQSEYTPWLRRMLCILLVEMGRLDEARERFCGQEKSMGLPPLPEDDVGKRCLVPVPLVTQNKDQCVPTSVAMAAWPQGRELNADQLFREMHGRDGTAIWQMRAWAENHGFVCRPIRLDQSAITEMLDAGIPLIGVLEGVFNSHVEVVCGYSEKLDVLYVRDPAHWVLTAWPWKLAVSRYEMWSGVIAIIDSANRDAIAIAERWKSADCAALIDLSEHVATGDFTRAAVDYESISEESHSIVLREQYAAWTIRTPQQYVDKMKQIAANPDAPFVARFRAWMTVDESALRELVAEEAERAQQELGRGGFRFLRLRQLMFSGEWDAALALVNELLDSAVGVAPFWDMKSDILAQLGQHEASLAALHKAIELEPLRVSLREKLLARSDHELTYQEYLFQLESLISEDPASRGLLMARAHCLRDDPDGLKYEAALRDVTRWYPKHSSAYSELMWWFAQQDRTDLAEAVRQLAAEALPDEFSDDSDDAIASTATASDSNEEAGFQLPEETPALLNVALNDSDHREMAIGELMQRHERGQLDWFEQAKLLVARIRLGQDAGGEPAQTVECLPQDVPGATHWFLDAFADELTEQTVQPEVAQSVQLWMRRILPSYENYQHVWFHIVLLLEHANRNEDALRELGSLLERYPKMSSALYRMGVIKINQADWASAQEWLERALEVNPGLYGGMAALRHVYEQLGDSQGELRCVRMLRSKFPYDMSYLRDEVLTLASSGETDAALERIDSVASQFPNEWLRLLRAHVLAEAGQVEGAMSAMAGIEVPEDTPDEMLFETHLRAALSVASATENHEEAAALCDRGLRRWPDSAYLASWRAFERRHLDPQRALAELKEFLYQRTPDRSAVRLLIEYSPDPAVKAARQLIEQAPEARRQQLAEWSAEVLDAPQFSDIRIEFLEWAYEQFPESDRITADLAFAYDYYRYEEQAVQVARAFQQRNANDPAAMRLLGRCLIPVDPEEAKEWLEKACQRDRNVNYLFDLARCYQHLHERDQSIRLHWEILRQNPHVAASWTALYYMDQDLSLLWPFVPQLLEAGVGVEDESFLVAVVDAARRLRCRVSPQWYELAKARWQLVAAYGGHGHERELLPAALTAWQIKHPRSTRNDPRYLKGLWPRLKARFSWPGTKWIPPNTAG